MTTFPVGTIELLVRHANGTATGDEAVSWAITALGDGFDSPSLRRLAGLNPPVMWSDAMPLFKRAADELQLQVPPEPDALLRAFLRSVAEDIVSGARSPAVALDIIHREVIGPLNHPGYLMPWCYLSGGLDPVTFEALDDTAVASAVHALARETLAGSATRPA
jgi:hypothetical protein